MTLLKTRRYRAILVALLLGTAAPAVAAPKEFVVEVELPRISVAEYHKPYVAGWIEDANGKAVAPLLVWYDVKKKDAGGKKWLPDLKTWWRRAGRTMTIPANGITGATRAPGRNVLAIPAASNALTRLPAGQYSFVIEAAREGGGREVVKAPFKWKPGGTIKAGATGTGELRTIRLTLR